MAEPSRRRVGARQGRPDTRAEVLAAAQLCFATGYAACTLRQVAKAAQVDPSLVVHYFGGKEGMFLAAMHDLMDPAGSLGPALSADVDLGRGLAGYFLSLWEDPTTRLPLQGLLLSAASHPPAAELLATFIERELIGRVIPHVSGPDADIRAAVAGSQLIGFALARYLVGVPALARLTLGQATDLLAARVDACLRDDAQPGPPARAGDLDQR